MIAVNDFIFVLEMTFGFKSFAVELMIVLKGNLLKFFVCLILLMKKII